MQLANIAFIGGGRICRIILTGLSNKAFDTRRIWVYDCDKTALDTITNSFPAVHRVTTAAELEKPDLIVLAVHPQSMNDALDTVKPLITEHTVILSLAPKITIGHMQEKLGGFGRIVRCNPNAASIINRGYNPLCFASGFPESDKEAILLFLEPLGSFLQVDEPKLEAYAVVSAMAPTYFWYLWDELYKSGLQCGLTDNEAKDVLKQVLPAAVDMYLEYGMDAYNLIPARPFKDEEENIRALFNTKLMGIYKKLAP